MTTNYTELNEISDPVWSDELFASAKNHCAKCAEAFRNEDPWSLCGGREACLRPPTESEMPTRRDRITARHATGLKWEAAEQEARAQAQVKAEEIAETNRLIGLCERLSGFAGSPLMQEGGTRSTVWKVRSTGEKVAERWSQTFGYQTEKGKDRSFTQGGIEIVNAAMIERLSK